MINLWERRMTKAQGGTGESARLQAQVGMKPEGAYQGLCRMPFPHLHVRLEGVALGIPSLEGRLL